MPDEQQARDETLKNVIEIWKAIVQVQQHFNDISMRIRSMFVTILLALFAAIGILYEKKLDLKIGHFNIKFAILVPLFGIFGAYLFYFIDRYWYHRLLVGSVKHAMSIETRYKNELPELSLSAAIGAESPYEPRGVVRWLAYLLVSDDRFLEGGRLHSDGKIELFYKSVMLVLLLTTVILALLGGITVDQKTPPASATPPIIVGPARPPLQQQHLPEAPVTPPAPLSSPARKTE